MAIATPAEYLKSAHSTQSPVLRLTLCLVCEPCSSMTYRRQSFNDAASLGYLSFEYLTTPPPTSSVILMHYISLSSVCLPSIATLPLSAGAPQTQLHGPACQGHPMLSLASPLLKLPRR